LIETVADLVGLTAEVEHDDGVSCDVCDLLNCIDETMSLMMIYEPETKLKSNSCSNLTRPHRGTRAFRWLYSVVQRRRVREFIMAKLCWVGFQFFTFFVVSYFIQGCVEHRRDAHLFRLQMHHPNQHSSIP